MVSWMYILCTLTNYIYSEKGKWSAGHKCSRTTGIKVCNSICGHHYRTTKFWNMRVLFQVIECDMYLKSMLMWHPKLIACFLYLFNKWILFPPLLFFFFLVGGGGERGCIFWSFWITKLNLYSTLLCSFAPLCGMDVAFSESWSLPMCLQ